MSTVRKSRMLGGLVLVGVGLAARATPLLSPGASSDAVRAIRVSTQPVLQLKYGVVHEDGRTDSVLFDLSTDYSAMHNAADGLIIRDYRLKRIFRLNAAGAFINDSLYADVWYRAAELENRASINAMLSKAGLEQKAAPMLPQQPFWAESQMGVTTPKFPRPTIERHDNRNETSWILGADEIVKVRYRDEAVPLEVRAGLRRWWPSVAPIHPAIADDLAKSGKIPAELWVRVIKDAKAFEVVHWTLTQASYVKRVEYPLPTGHAAVPTETRGMFPDLFKVLAESVADKRLPPPQSVYVTYATEAISKSAGLEALTWTLEMRLAAGTTPPCTQSPQLELCVLTTQAGPLAKADPRTAIAFAAHSPDAADRAQFDSLPNAYFLRLLWATRPPGKDVRAADSEKDLVVALQSRPLANFCKDAGDFYAGQWNPFAAWQAYDFGRFMANHRSDDLLGNIDQLEARLAADLTFLF